MFSSMYTKNIFIFFSIFRKVVENKYTNTPLFPVFFLKKPSRQYVMSKMNCISLFPKLIKGFTLVKKKYPNTNFYTYSRYLDFLNLKETHLSVILIEKTKYNLISFPFL